jgi:tetratricopeptide (TPR) repeat protein
MDRSNPTSSRKRRFRLIPGGGSRKPAETEQLDRFLTETDPSLLASLQQEEGKRRRKRRWTLTALVGLAIAIPALGLSWNLFAGRLFPKTEQAMLLIEQGRRLMSNRELVSEDRYNEALHNFQRAAELAPDLAEAWAELGNCRLYNYQSEAAEQAFLRALSLEPGHTRALHGLGNLYLRRGEERKAEDLWRRAGQRDGMSQQLARLYLLQGRYHEAEARLAPLLAGEPGGELLDRMAQAARSRRLDPALRTLLEPEPTGRSPWADLGWRLAMEKRYPEATAAFEKALARVPRDVNALSGMGWALLRMAQPREARTYFQRALWLDADHVLSLNGLAHSLKDEGRVGDAITVWQGMTELYPEINDGTPGLAWTYYEMRNYRQAAVYFARLVKRYPYDSRVIEALNVAVENID